MNYLPFYKTSKNFCRPRRGIALLTTLVILSLLAIFMTEFSFETKLETKSIRNYQASFKSRNAVKSIFKAVLEGLEKQNEVKFFREYLKNLLQLGNFRNEVSFLNPTRPVKLPLGIINDFPDVAFFTPVIRPIDHLYNLNRIQTPPFRSTNPETKTDVRLANKFINILKKWNTIKTQFETKDISQNIKLNTIEILQVYASIFDWLDKDSLTYDSSIYGTIGAEEDEYFNKEPKIEIKNGFLDKLSEIKILNNVADKNIPLYLWEKDFTTFPVGKRYNTLENFSEIKPRINVNLATYDELIDFLEQFDQNTEYFMNYSSKNFEDRYEMDYFEKREAIVRELTKQPRTILNSEDIKVRLSNITQYDSKSSEYFIPFSFWYKIFLKTEIDNVQAEIESIISVDRNGNFGNVSKIIIHEFLLR